VRAILLCVLVAIGAAPSGAASDPPLRGIYGGVGPEFFAELDFNQSPALLSVWSEATIGGPLHSVALSLQQVGPERYAMKLNKCSCGVVRVHLAPTGLLTVSSSAGEIRFTATDEDVVRRAVGALRKDVQQLQNLRHSTTETDEMLTWPLPKCSTH
jgi:hypothetical protein